jgi:hypothetical protein
MLGLMKRSTHDRWVANHLRSCSTTYWEAYFRHTGRIDSLNARIRELEAALTELKPEER